MESIFTTTTSVSRCWRRWRPSAYAEARKQRRHPAAAIAFGSANALIVDELALLLDLKDVYWAAEGRESVDVAVGLIATGATVVAGMPFWPHVHRALRS